MMKALQYAFPYRALIIYIVLLCTLVVSAEDQQHPQNNPASRCELMTALDEVAKQVEEMSKRFGPYLRALVKHCSAFLGDELANAIKQAAGQSTRAQRSAVLAKAASKILSSDCRTDQPVAAASTIQPRCPGPSQLRTHKIKSPLKDHIF
jgi:hypothetical protein